MIKTFGDHLKTFALAANAVNDDRFHQILAMCNEYLEQNFNVKRTQMLLQTLVNQRLGLRAAWRNNPDLDPGPYEIEDQDGKANGLCAFAFKMGRPLWTVPKDRNLGLQEAGEEIEELWSSLQELPTPWDVFTERCHTIVAIPMRRDGQVYSIICFESADYLKPNELVCDEMKAIAQSLGILYTLKEDTQSRSSNTAEAVGKLRDYVQKMPIFDDVRERRVFVGFPDPERADRQVLGALEAVLGRYSSYLRPVYWNEVSRGGDIDQQIVSAIREARAAVFYLSERNPLGNGAPRFIDNPNVLFEAGFCHALRRDATVGPANWIAIREPNSPPAPFDLRNLRMITVPRLPDDAGERLNENEFRTQLDGAIKSLLKDDLGIEPPE